MGVQYTIDEVRKIVLSVGEGTLTDEGLLEYAVGLRSDPRSENLDEILDLSAVERVEVTRAGLSTLAARLNNLNDESTRYRVAVVASADVVYGMTRMYEALRSNASVRVRAFRNVEQARAWLRDEK